MYDSPLTVIGKPDCATNQGCAFGSVLQMNDLVRSIRYDIVETARTFEGIDSTSARRFGLSWRKGGK